MLCHFKSIADLDADPAAKAGVGDEEIAVAMPMNTRDALVHSARVMDLVNGPQR